MFFYTVLFVASLTVAIAIPLIYYIFKRTGSVIYETILPGSNSGSWAHLKARLQLKKQQNTPVVSTAEQTEAMINGLWLVREDKPSEIGKAYRVSRKTNARTLPNRSMSLKDQGTTIGPRAHGWYG